MEDGVIMVTLDPRATRLLQRQADLQAFLLARRVDDMDPDALSQYIRDQAFAMIGETYEAVEETHWKPWAVRPDGEPVVISKQRYIGELADVYIFFMNLMLAGGVTTTELFQAVDDKQTKNLRRWTEGYDAKSTKCPACRRAYDDEDVKCYPAVSAEETGSLPVLPFCEMSGEFVR